MDPLEWFNRNVLGKGPKPPSSSAIVPQTQQIFTNQNVPTPAGPRGMTPRLPGTKVGAPTTPLLPAAPAQGFLKGALQKLGKFGGPVLNTIFLTSSEDPEIRIKRLGYKSQEEYDQAMDAYEQKTGKSSKTGKPLESGELSAVDPQQAIPPVPVDPRGPGRLDDPIAGKGPDGNQVGSDAQPATPGLQGSAAPTPAPAPTGPTQETTRTNENGIQQKGKDLSSINSGLSAVGVGPLEDMGRFFTEGFIPGVKGQDNSTNMGFDSPNAETGTWSEEEGRIIEPSAGSATGGKPENVQDGTSAKPTVAEKVRQIRGARQQEFAARPGNRTFEQPDETPAASGPSAMRQAARRAFLDAPAGSGYNAIRARDAAVGVSNDGVLIDGELRQWADGVDEQTKRRAAYAATGGFGTREKLDEWTGQFLQPGSQKAPEKAEPQTQQEFDLSGADETTKQLVGMTQSPILSADMPEFSSQEDANKFLAGWKKKVGVS